MKQSAHAQCVTYVHGSMVAGLFTALCRAGLRLLRHVRGVRSNRAADFRVPPFWTPKKFPYKVRRPIWTNLVFI